MESIYETLPPEAKELLLEKDHQIDLLKQELAQIKRLIHGSKSERFIAAQHPDQGSLFETETTSALPQKTQTITYNRQTGQKKETGHAGRRPLPAHLERIRIEILPEGDLAGLVLIGEEITEELEYIPGKFIVNQFVRFKYAKPDGEGVVIGELPSRPIEKGIPGPALLAWILVSKYMDHLPCHRQIQQFSRLGMEIPASTMSEWVSAAITLIAPLYDVLVKEVLNSGYIQIDETPIKVLDRDKKGKTHLGYLWVIRSPEKNLVAFVYHKGRGREAPTELLKDYQGIIQTDGYQVYDSFESDAIKLAGCIAHARRKFEAAKDNDPDRAKYVLGKMQALYHIEAALREAGSSPDGRRKVRMKNAVPVLNELHGWFKEEIIKVTPQSLIGKAIHYALGRWDKLSLYATNGRLEIDNNLVENSIRPVAIGRKNYLFAGSHNAAQRSAMIYSLLGTCKINDLDPQEWMSNLFSVISDHKANRLAELLPIK